MRSIKRIYMNACIRHTNEHAKSQVEVSITVAPSRLVLALLAVAEAVALNLHGDGQCLWLRLVPSDDARRPCRRTHEPQALLRMACCRQQQPHHVQAKAHKLSAKWDTTRNMIKNALYARDVLFGLVLIFV